MKVRNFGPTEGTYTASRGTEKECNYQQFMYRILLPLLLVALTVGVYIWSLNYAFEFDDYANIVKYYSVRYKSWNEWAFKSSRWIGYLLNTYYYQWSPDTNKMDPYLYRLGSMTFHILAGLFVFAFVMLLKRTATKNKFLHMYGIFVAYATAGLFLLHPVQTQTVSYVIQSELEGMAGLFMAIQATCFLLYCCMRKTWQQVISASVLFGVTLVACGTKESIIVAPILLLLVDWFFVAQGDYREILHKRGWLHAIIFCMMFGFIGWHIGKDHLAKVFTFKLEMNNNLGNILTENPTEKIKAYPFCISQFKVLLHYIWIFIWPFGICVEYDWKLAKSFFALDALLPFLLLCLLGFWIARRLYKNKTDLLSFGVLWFFIASLPRCSFIPSSELLVDYKTYLPSIGLLFVFGAGLVAFITWIGGLLRKHCLEHYVYVIALTGFLGVVAVAAYSRNTVWRSAEEFWMDIVRNAPTKARGYNNLGVALCEQNRHKAAVKCFVKAIQLDDNYADPHNNLSVASAALGDLDKAIYEIKQSIRLMPAHPENYNNLATLLIQKNELEHVEALFNQAITLRPYYGKCHFNWGCFCHSQGKNEEAWQHFKDCCMQADYDNEIGYSAYTRMSIALQKYEDARQGAERWIVVAPQSLEAYTCLGQVAFLMKDYNRALEVYRHMQRMQPNNPAPYLYYAETLFMQKEYATAYEAFLRALERDPKCFIAYGRCAECLEKTNRRTEVPGLLLRLQAQNPPLEYQQKIDEYFRKNGKAQ